MASATLAKMRRARAVSPACSFHVARRRGREEGVTGNEEEEQEEEKEEEEEEGVDAVRDDMTLEPAAATGVEAELPEEDRACAACNSEARREAFIASESVVDDVDDVVVLVATELFVMLMALEMGVLIPLLASAKSLSSTSTFTFMCAALRNRLAFDEPPFLLPEPLALAA